MKISGEILEVLPMQTGTSRNGGEWKSQSYILGYNQTSQYPKKMMFSLFGDRIDKFNITKGQMVDVDFDVECREYNGRYYNDVRAWNVTATTSNASVAPEPPMNDVPMSEDDFPF